MKPEQWVIEDIRSMRQIKNKSTVQQQYLDLLLWYIKVQNEKD